MPSVDFSAANRLLALSLDRSRRPGSDPDHHELLGRFRTDPGYASAVREAAEPLGLRVLGVDPQLGLLLDTTADSPFALRSEDLQREFKWSSPSERVVYGVALVGIATFCYPTAASFNEPGVRQVTALEVDDWIRKAAESAQHQDEPPGEHISLRRPDESRDGGRDLVTPEDDPDALADLEASLDTESVVLEPPGIPSDGSESELILAASGSDDWGNPTPQRGKITTGPSYDGVNRYVWVNHTWNQTRKDNLVLGRRVRGQQHHF